MAMIYLSGFGGTGSMEDPFRPWIMTILDDVGSGIIDLRDDCTVADGWCLISLIDLPAMEHPSLVPLVDDGLLDQPAPELPAILLDKLGVDVSGSTAAEIFADLLINHYGLAPTVSHGGYVAFLGQVTLFDIPSPMPPSGGATDLPGNIPIVDDFNGGAKQTWVRTDGSSTFAVSSNKMNTTMANGGDTGYNTTQDMPSDDMFVQYEYTASEWNYSNCYHGPILRVKSDNSANYYLSWDSHNYAGGRAYLGALIYKCVAGAFTTLVADYNAATASDSSWDSTVPVTGFSAEGSTLRSWGGGVGVAGQPGVVGLRAQCTDTTFSGSGQRRVGFRAGNGSESNKTYNFDNFYAEPIVSGSWGPSLVSGASHSGGYSALSPGSTWTTSNLNTFTEGRLYVAVLSWRSSPSLPSCSALTGNGQTWTKVAEAGSTVDQYGYVGLSVWACICEASPTQTGLGWTANMNNGGTVAECYEFIPSGGTFKGHTLAQICSGTAGVATTGSYDRKAHTGYVRPGDQWDAQFVAYTLGSVNNEATYDYPKNATTGRNLFYHSIQQNTQINTIATGKNACNFYNAWDYTSPSWAGVFHDYVPWAVVSIKNTSRRKHWAIRTNRPQGISRSVM